ncbi:MAG TPA: alanine dehydrogenase [Firmicutes bacterium]|nr:alanine dehydrogenase [Bacillota bacterium]
MVIGVPKEIKDNENRVAVTPAGVRELTRHGHKVLIEMSAGDGSGITDEEYRASGAEILSTCADVYERADMIVKVKEPLPLEYKYIRSGQILFTYLHLAASKDLTITLLEKGVIGIAYETIQMPDGSLPLLAPMSEIAGRMAVQIGAHHLEKAFGGRGVLLGGVPGVSPAEVVIVGGGMVGTNAARIALGMGAHVTILDKNLQRLRFLDDIFLGKATTLISNSYNLEMTVPNADLLIGAVLIPGAKAPRVVSEEMVKTMRSGSVIVDVAIDQGGCVGTIDRVTTHSEPTYTKYGVVHYAVSNIPGAVARTSTYALTNATLPYVVHIASKGYKRAVLEDQALARGLNVVNGEVVHKGVAEAHNLSYTALEKVLSRTAMAI